MIKANSRKILLLLTAPGIRDTGLPEDFLLQLLPELSPAGQRSLIAQLLQSRLIWKERRADAAYCGATNQAEQTVRAIFPALVDRAGLDWHQIVLTRSTKQDPQFRSLVQLLKKHHWHCLARGVYVFPFVPRPELTLTLNSVYERSIVLARIVAWQQGYSRTELVASYHLEALASIYSSISNELNGVLIDIDYKKGLIYKDIKLIGSVLERFETALLDDVGLLPHLFTGNPAGIQIWQLLGQRVQHLGR